MKPYLFAKCNGRVPTGLGVTVGCNGRVPTGTGINNTRYPQLGVNHAKKTRCTKKIFRALVYPRTAQLAWGVPMG